MLSIRTNLSSFIAQNSMRTSTDKLNQAIERMTTGSKINHAKDNAANYSISTNMSTKMSALRVAEDNALQGLEMISSTSENLSIVEDKLARMRALSTQALNGTYSTQSLNALNLEADALLKEINRINESATYNGIKLFNTGKAEVTNAGKELKLNEQGFLQDVVKVDTTGMTPLSSMADDATLAVGEYTIGSKEELVQLKEMSDDGLLEAGSTFVMTKDIDMTGITNWNGIGATKGFSGIFNGNGHTISNLTGTQGLFSNVQKKTSAGGNSRIENVRLENVKINAGWDAGGLCGLIRNTEILNCSIDSSSIVLSSGQRQGGVVGNAEGCSIQYCYFNGNVTGNSIVGGIVGYGASPINCLVEGSVRGNNDVGGIIGLGKAINSKMLGTVTGDTNVGGITGSAQHSISSSYFGGTVNGNKNIGGIVGRYYTFTETFSNNIVEGSVNGNSDVGIFVGYSVKESSLKNCYYYSKVLGEKELYGENSLYKDLDAIDITVPCDYTFQVGVTGDDATSSVSYTTYIDFGGLKDLLTSGVDSAQCLAKIDELVEIVSLKQTELGTMENRLMSVLDEISTQYENLASSYSTIHDADIADVSSSYIKQQIIQQAGASLLASTQNVQYQNVMGLLQSLRR